VGPNTPHGRVGPGQDPVGLVLKGYT